jgi:putative membrane protein
MSDPRDRPRVIEEPGRSEPDEPLIHPRVIETDDTGPIDIGPIAMSSGELTPVKQVPPPSGRGLKALAIAGLGLAGMAGVTALWWAISLFEHSLGLGLAGTGFLALAFGGTGYLALHEARAIGRLREVKHLRERFEHTTDRARLREQLLELARELADAPTLAPGIARWRARAGADLPPEDALRTFEAMVLSEADKIAIAAIRRAARDTFGIVAVSPRAAVDIAVFVWRGLKLVREIGEAYGYRPSRASTVVLARRILADIGLITATDVAADATATFLGGSVLEKVSAAASEGAVAAWRMARFGLLAMESARPLPLPPERRPKMSDLVKV